jgi:hypothetical protein
MNKHNGSNQNAPKPRSPAEVTNGKMIMERLKPDPNSLTDETSVYFIYSNNGEYHQNPRNVNES